MTKKVLVCSLMATSFIISSCVSPQSREVAGLFGTQPISNIFNSRPPKEFSNSEVASLASVPNLNLQDARLIQDNDASFQSKLAMIQSAHREIRMVYFIYADDDSSSVISNALIKKAQSGVKVKLLVDFITNYNKFDHFQMMENEGKGNLSVHYYNFPTRAILEDAKYITLPCPAKTSNPGPYECAEFKRSLMAQISNVEVTPFSKMFLAGLYGRSGTALKISLGYGAQINPEDYKKSAPSSKEDRQHIFEFLKLLKSAATGDLASKIKLSLALSAHSEALNPLMNEITGRLPLNNHSDTDNSTRSAAWDHLTDYTHHKLLIVDGREFQLGGRNIEDSYHMKSRAKVSGREDKGKYIFMDTDFWAQARQPGDLHGIEATFDKLINFKALVVTSDRVAEILPNNLIKNTSSASEKIPSASEMATGACLQKAKVGAIQPDTLGSCIDQTLPMMKGYESPAVRMQAAYKAMLKGEEIYNTKYRAVLKNNFRNQPWSNGVDHLSASDLATAQFSYVENISYDRKNESLRKTGSRIGFEGKYNKNIHALWYRGLENACQVSRNENRDVRIIFHSAYLFMPSGMMVRLAKMLNGDYGDCMRVKVTFLTNSFATTDLNVINIAARYQMRALMQRAVQAKAYAEQFERTNGRRYERPPTLEYFEYNPFSEGSGLSLHTKISLIDQDMTIGSANADVRSYYMDTNNGIFIRGAKELNYSYTKFIDGLINDRSQTTEGMITNRGGMKFENMSDEFLHAQNLYILDLGMKRFDKKGKHIRITGNENAKDTAQKQNRQNLIIREIEGIGARITQDSNRLLKFREEFGQGDSSQAQEQLNKVANDFDDMFKLL